MTATVNAPISRPDAPVPSGARSRRVRAFAAAAGAVLLFSACTSDPGPKQVAEDIIKAEAFNNPDLDEECLLRELDRYSDQDLRDIAADLNSSDSARNEAGEAALLAYQRSLEVCI